MLEKQIEKAVCDYAKSKGVLCYKFVSPGHAGVPDRMFILPGGKVFFIEFKRMGGKATPLQLREIERLHSQGVDVAIVDNVIEGQYHIDKMLLILIVWGGQC